MSGVITDSLAGLSTAAGIQIAIENGKLHLEDLVALAKSHAALLQLVEAHFWVRFANSYEYRQDDSTPGCYGYMGEEPDVFKIAWDGVNKFVVKCQDTEYDNVQIYDVHASDLLEPLDTLGERLKAEELEARRSELERKLSEDAELKKLADIKEAVLCLRRLAELNDAIAGLTDAELAVLAQQPSVARLVKSLPKGE